MALFTPEELEELRRADAELDESFTQTQEEIRESQRRDRKILNERKTEQAKKITEYKRAYYKKNREKILEYKRGYDKANHEKIAGYKRTYYKKNREKILESRSESRKRRKAMAAPRMTIKEVADDMRSRGMGLAYQTITDNIANGTFPFGTVLNTGKTGRRTFLILRRDYEAWAEKYLVV